MSLSPGENSEHFNFKKINIQENNISKILNEFNNTINNLKTFLINNKSFNINEEEINNYFVEITKSLDILENIINSNMKQNESIIRKDEQSIRKLYAKCFNQKLINEVHENKIANLSKKEKEYELLKQKTGAIIVNGQIICNERKDNEIIILRTENSLLKTAIKNNEDLLKEKNEIINSLNNDILLYKNQIDELNKEKHGKYSSFSNINININEPKKDYLQKLNKSNKNNSYINTIQFFSSNKKIGNENQNTNNNNYANNKNSIRNIYSSYQMNSQLINRVNNAKNKNRINNKEEIFQNYDAKNINKNETLDSFNNKTYSIKYISVNKSLFSPRNNKKSKMGFNNNKNDEKTLQINRIKKNKFILNNNLSNREYKTIVIDKNNNKEVKVKKAVINKRLIIKHRKANSIQWPENSIKQLIRGKKNKILSIENEKHSNIYSAIKKLTQIKNQSLKNNKSLPSSIIKSIADGFRKNNQINSEKCLTNFLMPYVDKKNDKGRNENNSKIDTDYIKDNSLSFLQQTFMNKTSCENYFNNDKNSFNGIYNNSTDLCRDINPNHKK